MKTLTDAEILARATKGLPKSVREFALAHRLRVGRHWDAWGGYYFVADPTSGAIIETTRTAHPKPCHALAMCRRYLGRGAA